MLDDLLAAARAVLPAGAATELHDQMQGLQELASLTAALQAEVTATYVACRRAEDVAMPGRSPCG